MLECFRSMFGWSQLSNDVPAIAPVTLPVIQPPAVQVQASSAEDLKRYINQNIVLNHGRYAPARFTNEDRRWTGGNGGVTTGILLSVEEWRVYTYRITIKSPRTEVVLIMENDDVRDWNHPDGRFAGRLPPH